MPAAVPPDEGSSPLCGGGGGRIADNADPTDGARTPIR
jgi:hypothetical protein